MNPIAHFFRSHFEILRANTQELREAAYALRYQVYCQERAFEDATRFHDRREWDECDAHSVHSLIRYHHTGEFVGCVRLILPNPSNAAAPLPVEKECGPTLEDQHHRAVCSTLDRSRLAEVSRFSAIREFNRHPSKRFSSGNPFQATEQALNPISDGAFYSFPYIITFGLIAAAILMSVECGIAYCYAFMQPSLLRLLSRFGVHFQPMGSLVRHRGYFRYPAITRVADAIQEACSDMRELLFESAHFPKELQNRLELPPRDEATGWDRVIRDYLMGVEQERFGDREPV